MKKMSGVAAFVGVLLALCALVAWEWYIHVGRRAPQPVKQISAGRPAMSPASAPASSPPSASPGPVIYIPRTPSIPAPSAGSSARPARYATPVPSVTLTPYAVGTHGISSEPMAAATIAPSALNVAAVREPADAPPRILAMSISTPVAHGGEVVSGTVETSSNVASVEARIAGYSSSMQKVGVGRFVLSYRVPKLPFFLHRTYSIEVIARNTRGDAVSSSLPLTIR